MRCQRVVGRQETGLYQIPTGSLQWLWFGFVQHRNPGGISVLSPAVVVGGLRYWVSLSFSVSVTVKYYNSPKRMGPPEAH